jgi:U2-associated protein SR140
MKCIQIVEIICKTLMIKETPIPTKVARLYLVSDILHNSSVSVPNAWKFRTG